MTPLILILAYVAACVTVLTGLWIHGTKTARVSGCPGNDNLYHFYEHGYFESKRGAHRVPRSCIYCGREAIPFTPEQIAAARAAYLADTTPTFNASKPYKPYRKRKPRA